MAFRIGCRQKSYPALTRTRCLVSPVIQRYRFARADHPAFPIVQRYTSSVNTHPISAMSEVTLYNSLREKLLKDEVAYTLSVKLVRSVELPMMAKTAGFDGILIDMEHSSFDLDTTGT